jgi:hypothetical protein
MEQSDLLRRLIEIGVVEETDDPVNVMLEPLTDLNANFPDPPQDDLEAFYRQSAQDPFWATLGHAIQANSRLEQSLCRLFQNLTGMTEECAGIIFYKIINASTLHGILETLAKLKYGELYSLFLKSVIAMLRQLSDKRNRIVHWRAGIHPHEKEIRLTLPRLHFLKDIGASDYLNTAHLNEFIAKCKFIQTQIYDFLMMQDEFWKTRVRPDVLEKWQERFQREAVYKPLPSSPT